MIFDELNKFFKRKQQKLYCKKNPCIKVQIQFKSFVTVNFVYIFCKLDL